MPFTHPRMRRERRTIELMMQIFCRDQHHSPRGALPPKGALPQKGALCGECQALQDYALQRLERCPFQEDKPTCAKCAVHCYQPEMRRRVREVMVYAGPRMLLEHPIFGVRHLLDGRRKAPVLKRRNE